MLVETLQDLFIEDDGQKVTDIDTDKVEWMCNTQKGMLIKLSDVPEPIKLRDTIGSLWVRNIREAERKAELKVQELRRSKYGNYSHS